MNLYLILSKNYSPSVVDSHGSPPLSRKYSTKQLLSHWISGHVDMMGLQLKQVYKWHLNSRR